MRRITSILLVTIAMLFSFSAWAGDGVGIVDMRQILQSSTQIKSINKDLNKQFASRKESILKMGRDLQKEIKQYRKNKSILSKKKLTALQHKIGKQESELRAAQLKFQQDLFVAQNKQMKSFMKKLHRVARDVAKDKKLDLVLTKNTVLYSSSSVDITSDVLKKLKK